MMLSRKVLVLAAAMLAAFVNTAQAQDKVVRFGWCVTVYGLFAAPFAIIKKMGYDKQEGLNLQTVPLKSGGDCVTFVSTGQIDYALASIEPIAAMTARGAKLVEFYNQYQAPGTEIVVPEDSPIKSIAELKGKKIGVREFTAPGTVVAKGLIKAEGMDPEKDVKFVSVGSANAAALFLKDGTLDAISINTSDHATISLFIGPKLRHLASKVMDSAPGFGLVTTRDNFEKNKKVVEAVGRMYTKASVFMTHRPEAAVQILFETWPQTVPQNRERKDAMADNVKIIKGRFSYWIPSQSGVKYWGEAVRERFDPYLKAMADWEMIPAPVKFDDFVTNELIPAINNFDQDAVKKQADAYPVPDFQQ